VLVSAARRNELFLSAITKPRIDADLIFRTPVGGDAVVPWEANGFPYNVLYSMLSTCSRKLSELDVCFELQSPYLDEKDIVLAR
jgi:hypothetical protein